MTISDNCYFSKNIYFKKRMLKRFKNNKIVPGIFVIRLADEPDQLEIIRADYLKQEILRNEDKIIVGFASGYDDALNYVLDVTDKAIEKIGFPSIKEYLMV